MRTTKLLLALGLLGLTIGVGLWGCSPDNPTAITVPLDPVTDGRFARPVVSIGNSLTAGHIGSGLAITGQLASFPNMLSMLVSESITGVPGGISIDPDGAPVFMQMPLIYRGTDPTAEQQKGIGSTTAPDGSPLTGLFVDGVTFGITADLLPLAEVQDWLKNASYPLAYDNLGVPGAYTEDANKTIDSAGSIKPGNSFFDFILRNSALPPFNTTQRIQLESHFTKETIVGLDPDTGSPLYGLSIPRVITVWLGGNDILLGTAGGNPVVGDNVVSASAFESFLVPLLDQVAQMAAVNNSQVALGNNQTRLPFMDTVPLGADVGGTFVPWNTEESNVVFVLLTAGGLNPPLGPDYLAPAGGTEVIPSTMTLTQTEWDAVAAELAAYNQIIADQATARGWALADVDAEFGALPMDPAQPLNGIFPWADFTGDGVPEQNQGSAYSLDGIHNSEKGYAQIANIFADALNATYGTSYGNVDLAGVNNIAGFEQVLAGKAQPASFEGPLFTPLGVAALSGLPELSRSVR